MKMGTLICKVSRELYLRSYQNTKQQKIALSFITKHQLGRRWNCNSTTSIDTHENRAQQIVVESVKVISREIIKPSSPTSNRNKNVYFSLIDQLSPCVYNSIVLFYKNDPKNNNNQSSNNIEKRTKLLKQSLSEVLVDFYPFAGRIKKNELIECNDEGVEFCEANIPDKSLTKFIENPSVVDIEALLPFQGSEPRKANIVLSVQVNHFGCGGMALGVCLSHKITDGEALTDFLNKWSTKTRDSNHITLPPIFNAASLFPPFKEFNDLIRNQPVNNERIGLRRLIFDKKTLNTMKAEASSTCAGDNIGILRPTTNEVLAAFILKRVPKFTSVVQYVNLRTKIKPPIPANSIGNFISFTFASTSSSPSSSFSCSSVINELRKSVKKINSEYIQYLMCSDESLMILKNQISEADKVHENILCFGNISRLSVYEADFGMGKPIWACLPHISRYKNMSLVMSTPCGEGVEVWICMLEDDIVELDRSVSHLGYPVVKYVSLD